MKVPAAVLIVAAMLTAWPARASAQNPWVVEWLREYPLWDATP
jgi:hypothetical protein